MLIVVCSTCPISEEPFTRVGALVLCKRCTQSLTEFLNSAALPADVADAADSTADFPSVVKGSAASLSGSAGGAPTSLPAPPASVLRSFSHTHTFAAAAERAIQFSSSINSTE